MSTYQSIYKERCYADGTPHYWDPQPMESKPFTLFGQDDELCDESWGVAQTVSRVLALGLHLELPVGQWVYDARKDLDIEQKDTVMALLKSNIKDEHAHDKGFRLAAKAYPILGNDYEEAGIIADRWLSNSEHPLAKAAISEVGIFLVTLGVMRVVGGGSLCTFAARISHDEARHVTTNRSVLFDTGYRPDRPSSSLTKLRVDTLAWAMEHLNVPSDELGSQLDADYLIDQSTQLVATGTAPDFDELVYMADHSLPFELSNSEMYDRGGEEVLTM